jgi:hypothetical protein
MTSELLRGLLQRVASRFFPLVDPKIEQHPNPDRQDAQDCCAPRHDYGDAGSLK